MGGGGGFLQHGLNEYIYNYGSAPVAVIWSSERKGILMPGDSAYIQPMVKHQFDLVEGTQPGHLAVIRIPGGLSGSVLSEFSTFAPEGRNRVNTETMRWF